MTSNKKSNAPVAAQGASGSAAAKPGPAAKAVAKPVTAKPVVAKAVATKAVATKPAAAKPVAAKVPVATKAPAKPAAPKPAKSLEPAVQASKEALAKALAAAQAVKIEKPLGQPAKPEKAEKPVKAPKAKKPKLVRDSFTMPEDEYSQIAGLKKRLLGKGVAAKKSELLRAGVALLAAMGDGELAAALAKVNKLKTGRPAKSGK